jgi:hypothetical protein
VHDYKAFDIRMGLEEKGIFHQLLVFHLDGSISISFRNDMYDRNILVTAIALVENSGSFVCASQLLGVVADLLAPALFAALGNDTGCVHVIFRERLDLRALCAQS